MEDEDASRAYLLQVWAEAMTIYRSGHYSMKFSKSIQRQLVEVQKDFMPEDTEAGQIQAFWNTTPQHGLLQTAVQGGAGHTYDEPKRWQLHNINEIMNTVVTGWKPFSNPRCSPDMAGRGAGNGTFRQRTARQRRWICGADRGRMLPAGTAEGVDRIKLAVCCRMVATWLPGLLPGILRSGYGKSL